MPKIKAHDEFVEEIYQLVGDEYKVTGNYINSTTKVKLLHSICGNEYTVLPKNFTYRNQRCPHCCKTKPRTRESFIEELKEIGNNEYELIGEFINSNTPTLILHKNCGYEWNVSPTYFSISEKKCPKCSGNIRKKTTEIFKQEVFDLVKDEYIVIGDYKAQSKVKMKHCECGHEWDVKPTSFLKGTRCPKCNGGIRKTTEQFKREVHELVQDEYVVLGEYENNITRVPILHIVCGEISDLCPIDFIQGGRCLHCNTSHGEKEIYSFLTNNSFIFKMQFKFKKCKRKRSLPFDFAIFDNSENLICLIEYDGIQHFEHIEVFGGLEAHLDCKRNDQIKNTYCEENNIKLIRIPYWDFNNIEEILNKELIN